MILTQKEFAHLWECAIRHSSPMANSIFTWQEMWDAVQLDLNHHGVAYILMMASCVCIMDPKNVSRTAEKYWHVGDGYPAHTVIEIRPDIPEENCVNKKRRIWLGANT